MSGHFLPPRPRCWAPLLQNRCLSGARGFLKSGGVMRALVFKGLLLFAGAEACGILTCLWGA